MHRKILLAAAAGLASLCAKAQQETSPENAFINFIDASQTISRTPVKPDGEARLFSLPAEQMNHYFRVNLPGDNFFTVTFDKLSYWPSTPTLATIFQKASEAVEGSKSTFKSSTSSKKVYLHLPVKNTPVLIKAIEYEADSRTFAIGSGTTVPVKVTMDTVQVLKNFAALVIKKDTTVPRIQYSFILKDANDLARFSNDEILIQNIEHQLDSIVQYRRKKWKNQDMSEHTLSAELVFDEQDVIVKKVEKTSFILQAFHFDMSLGGSLLTQGISPYIDFGINYQSKFDNKKESSFIRLFFSNIITRQDSVLNYMSYINLESGTLFSGTKTWLPVYKTSAGIGYKFGRHNESPFDMKYRLFFNYSVTKSLTITPEFFYGTVKGEAFLLNSGGVTLSLRFF